jgi:hypothetical protein
MLLNADELTGRSWTVSFGGGTSMSASLSVDESSAIMLDEKTIITTQNFTATPSDLYKALYDYGVFKISYSLPNGAPKSPLAGTSMSNESYNDDSYSWVVPVWSDSISLPFDYGPLHASLTVTPSLSLSGYVGWDFEWVWHTLYDGIKYPSYDLQWFEAWITAEASVKVNVEASASISYSETWPHTLFDWPYTYYIPGTPVWVDLRISSKVTLTFNAYGEVSFEIGAEAIASLKVGARWTQGVWENISNEGFSASRTDPQLTIRAGASITASLDFRVSALLEGLIGPFIDFVLSASANLAYTPPIVTWDVLLNFRIDVGVTFAGWLQTLLGLNDYSTTVYQKPLKEWSGHMGFASSSISVNVNPSTITVGSEAIVSGSISSSFGGNKSGIVDLQFSTDNATWDDAGSSTSDPSGYYSYKWVPSSTGTYYVRSKWGGNSYYSAAISSSFFPFTVINGSKLGSGITISLSSTSITTGQSIILESQLGLFLWFFKANLTLNDGTTSFQQGIDGIEWQNMTAGTPTSGYFSCSWTPPSAGTYYLRATWSGDASYYGSISSTATLQVTPANTSLTTSLSANVIYYPSSANIAASMFPALQEKTVMVEYSNDNSTWYFLSLGNTDSYGQYTYSWTPNIGTYYLRSRWTGDADYFGTISASQSLTVNQPSQFYLDVLSSYGTVSGMGWYDVDTAAYATLASQIVDIIPGSVRAIFTGWSGDATGTGLTSDPIIMNGPKTAVATWKIQFVGDVNGDGTVNMADISIQIDAFLSYPGHPAWNPDADLNADGSIDMMDLVTVLGNFGKTYF